MECIAKIIRFNITLIILFHTLAIISCTKEIIEPAADGLYHDYPSNDGIRNALEKARLIAEVEWTPLNPVPSCYGYDYPAFETRHGLPYSLAQKVNGYVGLDVSFYTFLTAVKNPSSVMYTEDLRNAPYNGFDCAPYYGSVCSMSVWYALGIKATYFTSSINSIPELKRERTIGSEGIKLCDVLWNSGHVAMVYDIGRNDTGAIQKVSIFETTRANNWDSKITDYSYAEFVDRWNRVGWVIYRPIDLSSNPSGDADIIAVRHLQHKQNELEICTSRGDKASFVVGDSVVINVLSRGFNSIELYRNGSLFQTNNIDTSGYIDVVYRDLPYGSYKARLGGNAKFSSFAFFEVIDVNVSAEIIGDSLNVHFSSFNAEPVFIAIVNAAESPHYCQVLTQEQLNNESATVPITSDNYLKVFFKGEYGRVTNKKIKIK